MAFVQALGATAGQAHLRMCFVHQDGYDTTCRASDDGTLTLIAETEGNPKLTAYSGDKLTYTFGRLGGLAGTVDGYDPTTYTDVAVCIPRTPGTTHLFGFMATGLCETKGAGWDGVWHGEGCGASYRPYQTNDNELGGGGNTSSCGAVGANPSPDAYGFRLYIGPSLCGNGVTDPGEQCDDGNDIEGDTCLNNCTPPDPAVDYDQDGTPYGEDCDDTNGQIHPFAGDIYGDGTDSDCDGLDCNAALLGSKYYAACPDEVTWDDGQAACVAAGYEGLASILSSVEHSFVKGLLLNTYMYYFGLRRINGLFTWVDGSALSYSNWSPGGEPDGSGDCGKLVAYDNFYWGDNECNMTLQICISGCPSNWIDRPYGFICSSDPAAL
jgi:cysteine-rich repeat protein